MAERAKRSGNFRNAAGGAVGQPLARVRVGIIERRAGLQVQDHHGSLRVLDDRQDLGGSGVGSHVAEDQIDAGSAKGCPGLLGFVRIVHQAGADHGGPLADALFHFALVTLQPFFESVKLRPVRRQANPEYSHLCVFRLSQVNLRRGPPLCRKCSVRSPRIY